MPERRYRLFAAYVVATIAFLPRTIMSDDSHPAKPQAEAGDSAAAFACHNSKDKDLVREICRRLVDEHHVAVWIDERGIEPGDRYWRVLEQAIAAAKVHLVFLSRHGIGPVHEREFEVILGLDRKIIPVVLPGGAIENIPLFLRHSTHAVDFSDGVSDEGLERIAEVIRAGEPPTAEETNRREEAHRHWAINNLPARNLFFTGRENELAEVADCIAARRCAVLSGLGGTGKTAAAKEYAHRHRGEFTHVFLVSAANPSVLFDGFVEIARLLEFLPRVAESDEGDHTEVVQRVRIWLADHEGWLLVFDNADDDADASHQTDMLRAVKDSLPETHRGHVLVTTRRTTVDVLGVARPVAVNDMLPEDARVFLLRRTGREQASGEEYVAAVDLAFDLGYLALALEQAAAYILAQNMTFADYRASYGRRSVGLRQAFLNRMAPVMGERESRPLATTWLMNFEMIEAASEASAELLRLLAFVHPEGIPLELITAGGPRFGPHLAAALADDDPAAVSELLEPLRHYSLVTYDREDRTLSMHRMVQQVIIANLDESTCRDAAESAVRAVAFAPPGMDFQHWHTLERWLPHAMVVADWIEQYQIESNEAGSLLNKTAYYLDDQARYEDAEPLYQRALAIWEKVLGRVHPSVAT